MPIEDWSDNFWSGINWGLSSVVIPPYPNELPTTFPRNSSESPSLPTPRPPINPDSRAFQSIIETLATERSWDNECVAVEQIQVSNPRAPPGHQQQQEETIETAAIETRERGSGQGQKCRGENRGTNQKQSQDYHRCQGTHEYAQWVQTWWGQEVQGLKEEQDHHGCILLGQTHRNWGRGWRFRRCQQ